MLPLLETISPFEDHILNNGVHFLGRDLDLSIGNILIEQLHTRFRKRIFFQKKDGLFRCAPYPMPQIRRRGSA